MTRPAPRRAAATALLAATVATATPAFAQNRTWVGPVNGDFATNANWSPSGAPVTSSLTAYILSGSVTSSSNVNPLRVYLGDSGGGFQSSSLSITGGNFYTNDRVYLYDSSTFSVGAATYQSSISATGSSTIDFSGATVDRRNNSSNTLQLFNDAAVTAANSTLKFDELYLVNNSSFTLTSGTFESRNNSIQLYHNSRISIAGGSFYTNNSISIYGSSVNGIPTYEHTTSSASTNAGYFYLSDASVTIDQGTFTVREVLTLQGAATTLDLSGATVNLPRSTRLLNGATLKLNPTGTVTLPAITIENGGTVDLSGSSATFVTAQAYPNGPTVGIDLNTANLVNAGNATLQAGGPDTLIILPAAGSPFAAIDNPDGITHTTGSGDLVIPAGKTYYLDATLTDRAQVMGTLYSNQWGGTNTLNFDAGIQVSGDGYVYAGNGRLAVRSATDDWMSGGVLQIYNNTTIGNATGDAKFTQSGGTFYGGSVTIGDDQGGGHYELTGGSLSATVYLQSPTGQPSSFTMSGGDFSGQLYVNDPNASANITGGSFNADLNTQSGGTINIANTNISSSGWNYIQNSSTVNLHNGDHNLGPIQLDNYGTLHLHAGSLTVNSDTYIQSEATLANHGGTLYLNGNTYLEYGYVVQDGSAQSTVIESAYFGQNGGAATLNIAAGSLTINNLRSLGQTTINMTSGQPLYINYVDQGVGGNLDLGGNSTQLIFGQGTSGNLYDLTSMSFSSAGGAALVLDSPNSLLMVQPGAFGSLTAQQGTIHELGNTLTIADGTTLTFPPYYTFNDRVVTYGTLQPQYGQLYLNNGLEVHGPNGYAFLGSADLRVYDPNSGVFGGSLDQANVLIGGPNGDAAFTVNGALSSSSIYVGSDGYTGALHVAGSLNSVSVNVGERGPASASVTAGSHYNASFNTSAGGQTTLAGGDFYYGNLATTGSGSTTTITSAARLFYLPIYTYDFAQTIFDGASFDAQFNSSIEVSSHGTFELRSGTITSQPNINIAYDGDFLMTGGDLNVVNLNVYYGGPGTTFTQRAGAVTATSVLVQDALVELAGGTFTANDASSWGGPGTLLISGGNVVIAYINPGVQVTLTAGTLAANTIYEPLVNSGGTLSPGNSPGTTTLNSDYQQSGSGATLLEIAGVGNTDRLVVNGVFTLGGFLQLALTDNFIPALGDTFDLLDFGTLIPDGYQWDLSLAQLPGGLTWDLANFETDGSITVIPEPTTAAAALALLLSLAPRPRRRHR